MRYLICLIGSLTCLGLASCAQATTSIPGKMFDLDFYGNPGPKTISHDGVSFTVQPIPDDDDNERTIVSIQFPNTVPYIVDLGVTRPEISRNFGIGRLNVDDQIPSVVLQNFSGGAHCCTSITIVQLRNGQPTSVKLGDQWDGGPIETFPTDIDNDGTVDFVMSDDRFLYEFGSYGGSMPPPLVYNIYKGQAIDVSDEVGFMPLFEKFSKEARSACADKENDQRNGACAGFVASESRLGRMTSALAYSESMAAKATTSELPSECQTDLVNYQCPAGKLQQFFTFGTAIRWFLAKHGYSN